MVDEVRQIVKQHIADAPAEDDAKRHPQDEIVEVDNGHRRLAAPQFPGTYENAGICPADQDAENVCQCVPADGERTEMDEDRIEGWIGNNE